jgi:hypothetical protein
MNPARELSDKAFREVEQARKAALASLIRRSGLPYKRIATDCGVERRAVKRAADGEGIRFDTAVRLEYYLTWYLAHRDG